MTLDEDLEGVIEESPYKLTERQLGPLVDKDPEWRPDAVYSRDEVEVLISSPRIPADRQMLYALDFLAGVRHGEAAALRWRHYDHETDVDHQLLCWQLGARGDSV